MKFENTEVWGFEHALRGMRNPMNSWDKSDSSYCITSIDESTGHCGTCPDSEGCTGSQVDIETRYIIGKNDMRLAQKLIKAGTGHRKFMRQIFVSVDVTAPLYLWKEFDQYKIGVTTNSCSTMHKLATTPITLDCFETDDCDSLSSDKFSIQLPLVDKEEYYGYGIGNYITFLEGLRQYYIKTKDKKYWKELVRWLPESWLQKRTITMSYENVYAIVHQRRNHKLNEWSGQDNPALPNFISWAKTLPYADKLIFIDINVGE